MQCALCNYIVKGSVHVLGSGGRMDGPKEKSFQLGQPEIWEKFILKFQIFSSYPAPLRGVKRPKSYGKGDGPLCRSTFLGLEAEWMALKKNPFSWANLRSGKNLNQNFRFLAHTQLRWGGWKGPNLAAKGTVPFAAAHFGVWRPMGGPKKTVQGDDIWDLGNWYMFDIKKPEHSL